MNERKCQQIDESGSRCDSGARWGVQLWLPCPSPGEATRVIGLKLTTEVCDAHRDNVRAFVLANREKVTLTFLDQGLPEPDFLNMRIEFPPVEGRDIKVLQWCDREGCSALGQFGIKLRFREIGQKAFTCEVDTGFAVCADCRPKTKAQDFLRDEAERAKWSDLLRANGLQLPDLLGTELEFVPLIDKVPSGLLRG